ncbi:MAG: hypothetical protein KGI91_00655 [Burkholderiales bacterium]|nr:hypothetical protein [Burkholderiales bacterium]
MMMRAQGVSRAIVAGWALSLTAWATGAPVAGQGTWETTLQARDVNHDGVADAYYDTSLNITWLADAFADGPPPGFDPGRPIIYWLEAHDWARDTNLFGVTGWRLPTVINDPLATSPSTRTCPSSTLDGSPHSLCGYNSDPTQSELAHMYYVTLGNKAPLGTDGLPQAGAGLTNTGPFSRLMPITYWTNTEHLPGDFYWSFRMDLGQQNVSDPFGAGVRGVWVVHDGDIAAVPEPTVSMLTVSAGLILLAWRRRRSRI